MWTHFQHDEAGLQFVEQFTWVKSLGIDYYLGIDGLGLLMVMLTALVVPLAIMGSWSMADRPNVYHALILWVQAGLFGTFTALNFFHWFLFWELGLVPAFFLVRLWGGPSRSARARRSFLSTRWRQRGAAVGFLASVFQPHRTEPCFDFAKLAEMGRQGDFAVRLAATV